MCRGSAVIAVGKKLTTIHLPPASAVLAVGVDLMTDPVSQRGHGSIKALRSDLGTRHLEVATKPDLSGGRARDGSPDGRRVWEKLRQIPRFGSVPRGPTPLGRAPIRCKKRPRRLSPISV